MAGFKIVKEMSKEELMDEIIEAHKEILDKQTVNQLRKNVVEIRLQQVKERLLEEAELREGPLGIMFGPKEHGDEEDS